MQVAGCRLQVAGCRCRLQVAGCRLQVAGCRLQVAGCRLQVAGAGCRLQVAGCRLQVAGAGCRLRVTGLFCWTRLFVRVGSWVIQFHQVYSAGFILHACSLSVQARVCIIFIRNIDKIKVNESQLFFSAYRFHEDQFVADKK